MIELYHSSAAICAYKVRIALEEKAIEWTSHLVKDTHSPDYLVLNPNGYVPTLVHNGAVLVESRIISEYIAERFPGTPLLPDDPLERYKTRFWSKQCDDTLHLSVFVLTFGAIYRDLWLEYSEEDLHNTLAFDPVKRKITMELLRDGYDPPWVAHALKRFLTLIADMDARLAESQWLAGQYYSLADIDVGSFIHRLGELQLDMLWAEAPSLARWINDFKDRPSYTKAIVNWLEPDYLDRASHVAHRTRHALEPLIAKLS